MTFATFSSLPSFEWPYIQALIRITLALALGLFVGLERERQKKDAGVRTFAFVGLIGCLGGLLGNQFALMGLGLLGLLIFFLNIDSLLTREDTELTTSAALIVTCFTGILCGHGHTLTPSALAVLTAALLAWKKRLAGFSLGLTDTELQSAILLGILAFVIFPALPEKHIDPWGLIHPRTAWVTVLLIAAIGFANYILLKMFGTRAVELTGFLGGLVNSTVTVTALMERVRENPGLAKTAYHGIILATLAMLVRNAMILVILAPRALISALPALVLMTIAALALTGLQQARTDRKDLPVPEISLRSPFSLASALKFGALFLVLEIGGTIAQRLLGRIGFFGVSLVGGIISSASAVASAGTLASHQTISAETAGVGAVIASLTSALINLPLVERIGREWPLTRKIGWSIGLIVLMGVAGVVIELSIPSSWSNFFYERLNSSTSD